MARVRDTARAVGWGGNNCTAKRSSRPPRRRRLRPDGTFTITLTSTGERWPVPGTKPSPRCCRSMASRCRSPARWGSCGACLTPVREGTRRPPGYRAVGGGKTGRRAAYCAVLLPQPVGQFSYRSRGIATRHRLVGAGDRFHPYGGEDNHHRAQQQRTAAGEDAAGAAQIKHRPAAGGPALMAS